MKHQHQEQLTREEKICAKKIATFTMTPADAQKSLERAQKDKLRMYALLLRYCFDVELWLPAILIIPFAECFDQTVLSRASISTRIALVPFRICPSSNSAYNVRYLCSHMVFVISSMCAKYESVRMRFRIDATVSGYSNNRNWTMQTWRPILFVRNISTFCIWIGFI